MTCIIHAHFINIAKPGSYQTELNKMLTLNNLPNIIAPDDPHPNKSSIFQTTTHNNSKQILKQRKQQHQQTQSKRTLNQTSIQRKNLSTMTKPQMRKQKHKEKNKTKMGTITRKKAAMYDFWRATRDTHKCSSNLR
ncbi:hypothetical protein GWK47_039957 [Chionoecetes opilio]|uniref:Uncharacterized protein n=1 Tax=Chionoecetes opilio TaxID=41210 RepID=A0A8J5D144_CHIOP|nr:hypothetical protein GWK47_039957 [Chionoecetes opilio]